MPPKRKSAATTSATEAAPAAKKAKVEPRKYTTITARKITLPVTRSATYTTKIENTTTATARSTKKPAAEKPAANDTVELPTGPLPLSLPARFVGKFDLYSTRLPFLMRKYLPAGASAPDFAALYDEVLIWQAKPDFSLRVVLTNGDAAKDAGVGHAGAATGGRLACKMIMNPMSDEELEPIHIKGGGARQDVAFGAGETAHRSTVGKGPGYAARLELDTAETGCGMVSSGRGEFKMRKVWEKDGKELFEGCWDIDFVWGPTLKRKGFGSGDTSKGCFWAVRARKDADGKEIGIERELPAYRY